MWNLIKNCLKFWYIAKIADRIVTVTLQTKPSMDWNEAVSYCSEQLEKEVGCEKTIAMREIISNLTGKMAEECPLAVKRKKDLLDEAKKHELEWKRWNPKSQHQADWGVYE